MRFRAKIIQPWKDEIVAELLMTDAKISFLGDVDMNTGIIVGQDIDIRDRKISGKVFVFSESRGSTVGSNVLYGLSKNGLAPKLIGTRNAEPVTISGAIFGAIPMVTMIDDGFFKELANGDTIRSWIDEGHAYLEKIDT